MEEEPLLERSDEEEGGPPKELLCPITQELLSNPAGGPGPTQFDRTSDRLKLNRARARARDLLWRKVSKKASREGANAQVIAADGFTYERSAIERWLSMGGPRRSPTTNAPLSNRTLTPNRLLARARREDRAERARILSG